MRVSCSINVPHPHVGVEGVGWYIVVLLGTAFGLGWLGWSAREPEGWVLQLGSGDCGRGLDAGYIMGEHWGYCGSIKGGRVGLLDMYLRY